ncbi:L,D-transpeptidase [Streptomyces acidicola]|uniref:L,D-transpeptidase n=1 Tax=Streptomyces acidicola TaxID=2596892 RepID=UPI003817738F
MSDDLARGLRQLAKSAEAPPTVPGAEVRRIAVRRRRRRRTAAVAAGGTVAAALAALLTVNLTGGGTDDRPAPAASPAGTPATPAPADATVDLSRQVLVIDDRELPVSAGSKDAPTPTGRMTVTGKKSATLAPSEDIGVADDLADAVKIAWVISLRAPDGSTVFIGARAYDEKAPDDSLGAPGWISLRSDDARWVYERLVEGSVVEVTRTASTPDQASRSARPSTAPSTAPSLVATPTAAEAPTADEAPTQFPAETVTPSAVVDTEPSGLRDAGRG